MLTKTLGLAAMAAAAAFAGLAAGGAQARDVLLTAAIGSEVVQLVAPAPKVIQVLVNDSVVYEDRESTSLAFVNAYNAQGRWLVLLQQNADGGCAARYRVLDLAGPKPSVSLPFGTCSTAPEVTMKDRALTVSMPVTDGKSADSKSTAAWTYQDGRLFRLR